MPLSIVWGPVTQPGEGLVITGPSLVADTSSSLTLGWTAGLPTMAWLEYGLTSALGSETTHQNDFTYTAHEQTITGLPAETTIYVRAHVVDANGTEATSDIVTFDTEAVPGAPAPGDYPAPSTLVYVDPTSKSVPAVGVWTTDTTTPGGDTQYLRVSGTSPARKQYSTHRPWNSDESYIYVEGSATGGGQHSLIRTSDWSVVRQLTPPGHYIWSHTNPQLMYGVAGNRLVSYNVDTLVTTTVRTFSGYNNVLMGGGDGGFSWDDQYFLLEGYPSSGGKHLISYDRDADSIRGTKTLNSTSSSHPNNYKMGPHGGSAIVNYENTNGTSDQQGVWLVNGGSLTNIRQLQNNGDHGDVGYDIDSNPIYVTGYVGSSGKPVGHYSYRMDQSGPTLDVGIITPSSAAQLFQAGHVSLQCIDRPGYAYLSAYGSWTLSSPYNHRTSPGYGQVVAFPTDGSARDDGNPVEVFGFHRSSHTQDGGDAAYDREPQACPNRDGSVVAITTKWDTSTSLLSGSTYVFLLRAAP
jgi:hypothetical protein